MRNVTRYLMLTGLEEIPELTEESNLQPIRNLTLNGFFIFPLRATASFHNPTPENANAEEEAQGTNL